MKRRRDRGIFMADALLALGLLVAVASALTASARSHANAMQRLDDSRAAARLAESVVTSLQAGGTSSTSADARIVVEPLSDASPAGASHKWVRVRVTLRDRDAELIGLVPATAAAEVHQP